VSPRGRDTTGRPLDPDEAERERLLGRTRMGAERERGSVSEEFSGTVVAPDKDAKKGSAVEEVDFSAAVSDGEADVQSVVQATRVHEVLEDLDHNLVALDPVKRRIREVAALLVINRLREEMGLSSERPTLHMSFTGNPGTGKTTVALRMAAILHRLGYVDKGHLVAVTRDDLVGQYVGHTAPKTKDVVKRALGGVLFIDEAYYLHRPENERDYGQEAIEVLLQVMESERQNLVVIMAGYKEPMEAFFQANPGMGSRVAHHIHFPDYSVEELMQIAQLMVEAQGYEISEDGSDALREYIGRRLERPRFAHGRSIRNAIERARMRQAMRLFDSGRKLTEQDLITIEPDDIRQSSVFDDTDETGPDSEGADGDHAGSARQEVGAGAEN
jgi:probable Rubsico expression protein CbbX